MTCKSEILFSLPYRNRISSGFPCLRSAYCFLRSLLRALVFIPLSSLIHFNSEFKITVSLRSLTDVLKIWIRNPLFYDCWQFELWPLFPLVFQNFVSFILKQGMGIYISIFEEISSGAWG